MRQHPEADEQELSMVRRAAEGDRAAARRLYELHGGFIAALAGRYVPDAEDARDVAQEALVKILTSLDTFEHRGPGSLRRWMARITVNEALKFLKESKRLSFTDLAEVADSRADDEPPPDDIPAAVIYEQIRSLPDGYRTVFNLHIIEGMSHRMIAAELGISESTSASQLHRAKALLAQRLKSLQKTKKSYNEPSPRRKQMA